MGRTFSSEIAKEYAELKAEWDTESRKSKGSIRAIQKPNDLKTAIKARSFRARDMNIR